MISNQYEEATVFITVVPKKFLSAYRQKSFQIGKNSVYRTKLGSRFVNRDVHIPPSSAASEFIRIYAKTQDSQPSSPNVEIENLTQKFINNLRRRKNLRGYVEITRDSRNSRYIPENAMAFSNTVLPLPSLRRNEVAFPTKLTLAKAPDTSEYDAQQILRQSTLFRQFGTGTQEKVRNLIVHILKNHAKNTSFDIESLYSTEPDLDIALRAGRILEETGRVAVEHVLRCQECLSALKTYSDFGWALAATGNKTFSCPKDHQHSGSIIRPRYTLKG